MRDFFFFLGGLAAGEQTNSGQQGGMLLKRNIFRKKDGSLYGLRDLKVRT